MCLTAILMSSCPSLIQWKFEVKANLTYNFIISLKLLHPTFVTYFDELMLKGADAM